MRILELSTFVDPVGGAEIYFLSLADELERRGHDVLRFGLSEKREANDARERVLKRPDYERTRLFRDVEIVDAFDEVLERHAPDVIHIHNLYSLGVDLQARIAASGVPVVQTVHDYSAFCPNTWCVLPDGTLCPGGAGEKCFASDCTSNYPFDAVSVLLSRLRLDLTRSFVDVAVAPSLYLTRMLESHGFRDVRHLHYFIDGKELEPDPDAEVVQRAPNQLLFLGRLEREKGVDVLLRAMPRVLAERPGTELTIVGDGQEADNLRALAEELELTASVRFHAKVPYSEVKEHYARATALVLPSIWVENSPLVAYECLLAGLPVIGSRIGGIPDLIPDGETGLIFTPRDADDLAQKAIAFLGLEAAERERFSERARERGLGFTLAKNIAGIEAAFADAIEARANQPAAQHDLDGDVAFTLDRVQAEIIRLEELFVGNAGYIQDLEAQNASLRAQLEDAQAPPSDSPATPPSAWRKLASKLSPKTDRTN